MYKIIGRRCFIRYMGEKIIGDKKTWESLKKLGIPKKKVVKKIWGYMAKKERL